MSLLCVLVFIVLLVPLALRAFLGSYTLYSVLLALRSLLRSLLHSFPTPTRTLPFSLCLLASLPFPHSVRHTLDRSQPSYRLSTTSATSRPTLRAAHRGSWEGARVEAAAARAASLSTVGPTAPRGRRQSRATTSVYSSRAGRWAGTRAHRRANRVDRAPTRKGISIGY